MYQFKFLHNKGNAGISQRSVGGSAGSSGFRQPSARRINRIQKNTRKTRLKTLAKDSFLPLVYGKAELKGKIAYATTSGSFLYVAYLFCLGEIDGFEKVYFSNVAADEPGKGLISKGGSFTTYLGTDDQQPDPDFSSLIDGYQDALPGVAYIVAKIPSSFSSVPVCRAVVRGKKVHNPKTGQVAYSANPALWLADFLTAATDRYGMAGQVDWDSVEAVQDANDEAMSNGEPRRGGGFVEVGRPERGESIIELLRAMAGCFVTREDFVYRLIPDRPADVSATFDMGNMVLESLKKTGAPDSPTAVEVRWTDASTIPWRTKSVWAVRPEVEAGDMPWIPSSVDLRGVTSASQAKREAIERLNKYLNDLTIQFIAFDDALKLQAGDIIEVSHDVGLSSKKFRLTREPAMVEPGRWRIFAAEYDPAVYSNEVITTPTYSDTELPDPYHAPDISGLSLTEGLGQRADGSVFCRIIAEWDQAQWPYLEGYEVRIVSGADVIFEGKVGSSATSFASPPVEEKRIYNVSVRAYSSITKGEWASDSITPVGRWWKPADVLDFHGFEAGGVCHFWWMKPDDLDIKQYELRYYAENETWDQGLVLNRLAALRYQTDDLPEGTWKVGIKAVDSLDQYSENVNEIVIEVTSDANSFKLASKPLAVDEANTGWHGYTVPVTDDEGVVLGWQEKYMTAGDVAFGTLFSQAMSNYDQPLGYYMDNAGDSDFATLERDYGKDYSGNFIVQRDFKVLRGAAVEEHLLRKDGAANADSHDYMSVKTKARYEAYHARTSGRGNVAMIKLPVSSHVSVNWLDEYGGPITSSASGPTTVTLQGKYSTAQDINISIIGTESADWTYDNLDLSAGTFDIYIFDKNGNQVARQFTWHFRGA